MEEEQTTELIPKVETGAGTPQTLEFSGQTPVVAPAAEPEVPRKPFVPPELLARRQPAPHSAALSLPFYQQAAQAKQAAQAALAKQAAQQAGQPAPSGYPAAYGPATQGSVLTASPSGPATSSVTAQPGVVQGAQPGVAQGSVPSGEPGSAQPAVGGPGRRSLFLAGAGIVVVIVIAVVVAVLLQNGKPAATPTKHTAAPAVTTATLRAIVTSFDPQGTGFRRDGDGYRTQTYKTATFGNLKPGVGLALDLGSARTVSTVSFDVEEGPLTVQLYAADQPAPQLSGYTEVGSSTSVDGPTTLSATAGKHQYWLVWVTHLGSHDGGYTAQISGVSVKGHS